MLRLRNLLLVSVVLFAGVVVGSTTSSRAIVALGGEDYQASTLAALCTTALDLHAAVEQATRAGWTPTRPATTSPASWLRARHAAAAAAYNRELYDVGGPGWERIGPDGPDQCPHPTR